MTTPLSVVVPDLDSPLVGGTIDALAAQRGVGPLEILVVGRDAPGRVPRDGSVRFLESERPLSPAAARNRGVEAASGERLLFTDADCRPDPDWAATLASALESAPVAGGCVRFALRGNRWAVADNIASFHELLGDRPRQRNPEAPLGSLNLGVRRDAWRRTGPFDESLVTSEDHDWYLRARAAGLDAVFEPAARVEHAAVRTSAAELVRHAAWYGEHFPRFRERHPGVFDRGPTWASARRLWLAAPLKAVVGASAIFRRHPSLRPAWRAWPGVVLFKLAWYRAVAAAWRAEAA